jgi:surface antigen
MTASTIAPTFTGWPSDWPRPYYCTASYPPRPYGWQCVVWAAYRYHQLTGVYVPFGWGNALTWDNGARNTPGWSVSQTPVVPSIACLQPGVDGAYADGHVCIVEQINSDDSVLTSNMNWGVPDGSSSAVEMVTHKPQSGLTFLYLTGSGATQKNAVGVSTEANITRLNSFTSALLTLIGVPQTAIDALNVASLVGNVNLLTFIGMLVIGSAVALSSLIFIGLIGL